MMERTELLKEAMNVTWEKIQKLEPGTKERKFMEETFCKMVELSINETKVEYDEYAREQEIDANKEAKAAELRLKIEQFKEEKRRSWIPSADAILLSAIFTLMTLILYVIEGKGVIAPKALRTLEKLTKFMRIA